MTAYLPQTSNLEAFPAGADEHVVREQSKPTAQPAKHKHLERRFTGLLEEMAVSRSEAGTCMGRVPDTVCPKSTDAIKGYGALPERTGEELPLARDGAVGTVQHGRDDCNGWQRVTRVF